MRRRSWWRREPCRSWVSSPSRSCIYTGGVIHSLYGTVTSYEAYIFSEQLSRSILCFLRVSSHLLLQLARFARLFSSGRSPLHIFLHRGASVHANSYRARTGNVGHVRWISSCVQWLGSGMHKSEIVPLDNGALDTVPSFSHLFFLN